MHKKPLLLYFASFITFVSVARADDAAPKPTTFSGLTTMNGFSLSQFGDFSSQWKQVTVRYREDTKEMRFVYANEIAAKALSEGLQNYPDGAVFAKIGLVSEKDAAFTSSLVPSGAKRFQFMVRDAKKFAQTDGWGYALFNGEGKTFPGEPHANSLACAACHKIVADRGYVFSKWAQLKPFVERTKAPENPVDPAKLGVIKFETAGAQTLDERLRRYLPGGSKKVRVLRGSMQKQVFDGTVNEIGPLLAKESREQKMPAVLSGKNAEVFAFAYSEENSKACGEQGKMIVGRTVGSNKVESGIEESIVRIVSYCNRP